MPCGVKRTLTDPHTRLVSGRKQESGSGVGGRHHPQQLAGPGGGIAITSNVTFVTVTSRAIMLDLNLQTNVLLIKVGQGQGNL